MARRPLRIGAAAVGGFLATARSIVLLWVTGVDQSNCTGEGCALEYAAVMSTAIIVGSLVGAVCGFVTYVLTMPRDAGTST